MTNPIQIKVWQKNTPQPELSVQSTLGQARQKMPLKISAQKNQSYEIIQADNQTAPEHIRVQRQGKNLQLFFNDSKAVPDVVINDYYKFDHQQLIGKSAFGFYFAFRTAEGLPLSELTNNQSRQLELGDQPFNGQQIFVEESSNWGLIGFTSYLVGGVAGIAALSSSNKTSSIDNSLSVNLYSITNSGSTQDMITAVKNPSLEGRGLPLTKISISINQNTYTVNTDASGYWYYVLPTLNNGNYTVSISGNDKTVTDTLSIQSLVTHADAANANTTSAHIITGNILSNDDYATLVLSAQNIPITTSVTLNGQYGSVKLYSNGSYEYTVNASNSSVAALSASSTPLQDIFSYSATDSINLKSNTLTINVSGQNDAPVITPSTTILAYTENATAAVINSAITLSDVDSATLSSATISISSGFTSGDILSFSNTNGITGSYNSTTGVLTLTGSASLENYDAALKSIRLSSTSDNPTSISATRTISWLSNDGELNSNVATSMINITAVNDAPVLNTTSFSLGVLNKNAPLPQGGVGNTLQNYINAISDADNPSTMGVAVTSVDSQGTLFYSINGGSTWLTATNVSEANALLLTNNAQTRLYFQPNTSFTGDINSAFKFRAWDQSTGTSASYANIISTGNSSAFSSNSVDVSVQVAAALLGVQLAQDTGTSSDFKTSNKTVNVTGLISNETWEYSLNGGQTWQTGTGNSFQLSDTNKPVWSIYQDASDLKIRSYINGTAQFDLRIGADGALSDINDLSNNGARLVADHIPAGHTDRVLQWTIWDHNLKGVAPGYPAFAQRFNVTQAGDELGQYNPTIAVDVHTSGIIDVWSKPNLQYTSALQNQFSENITALTRYEFLADGVVKVRHLVKVNDVMLNGNPSLLTSMYFENWLPFLKNNSTGFTSVAMQIDANGSVLSGYSTLPGGTAVPSYPNIAFKNTNGYAIAYNELSPGTQPAMAVVFGKGVSADGNAAVNFLPFDVGICILPSLTANQTIQNGAVIDSSYYLVMNPSLSGQLLDKINQYVGQASAPVIWQPNETADSTTSALINQLNAYVNTTTTNTTDNLFPLTNIINDSPSNGINLPISTESGVVNNPAANTVQTLGALDSDFGSYDANKVLVRTSGNRNTSNSDAWIVDTAAPVIGLKNFSISEDWAANSLTISTSALAVQDASSTIITSMSFKSAIGFNSSDLNAVANGNSWNINLTASGANKTGSFTYSVTVTDAVGYSSSADIVYTVKGVNDQPKITTPSHSLATAKNTTSISYTIAELFNPVFTDADTASSLKGIFIQWNQTSSAQGIWQYKVANTSTWKNMPADLSGNNLSASLFLSAADSLQFIPTANYSGTTSALLYRVADNSIGSTYKTSTGTAPLVSEARVDIVSNYNNGSTTDGPISIGGAVNTFTAMVLGVVGTNSADTINDTASADFIGGFGGNDTINLNLGGRDVIRYSVLAGMETDGTGGNGTDTVNQFTVGSFTGIANTDRIHLKDLLIGYYSDSDGPAHLVNSVATIDAGDTIANYLSMQGNTLFIDRDGSGTAFTAAALVTLTNANTTLAQLLVNQQIFV
jgi:VCBS repeat-containing protein